MIKRIQQAIEHLSIEWDYLIYKSSDEYRQKVCERLAAHKQAMIDGTKSPYFD